MTNRVQVIRSSVSGNVPAAATRAPGELWVNFPDLQLGLIDAARNAQKLIAVRFFSTAAAYAAGDFVVQAGKLYFAKASVPAGAFNATQWTQIAALTDIPALYVLPTASTTVLGGVRIDGTTITINSGVISSAGLVTVSATAPSPVQNGALWYDLVGGQLYAWVNDGTSSQWVVAVNQSVSGVYLPMTGGTLTGPLTLAGDPVNPLDAATKQYVDVRPLPINDNRIINGDMRIDQRNAGASGSSGGYTIDRWLYLATQTSKGTWQRFTAGAAGYAATGFPYNLMFTSSSAFTPAAADAFSFQQRIEADMVSDFLWGTANAQPVTVSFWVSSSLTGTFGAAITTGSRSYPFSYSYAAANVWQKFVINIPGDTAGTWVLSGNATAFSLNFDLGSGANFRGSANAWASANLVGVTGAVSVVGTNGATFNVTGVKLETGNVATSFNRQSLARSLADCQRYYEKSYNDSVTPGTVTGSGQFLCYVTNLPGTVTVAIGGGSFVPFKVSKRSAPTIHFYSPTTGAIDKIRDQNSGGADITVNGTTIGSNGIQWNTAGAFVVNVLNMVGHWTADAEL